jgi:hypothetical protein
MAESKIAPFGDFYPDGFAPIFIRKISQPSRGVHFYPETTPNLSFFRKSLVFFSSPLRGQPGVLSGGHRNV